MYSIKENEMMNGVGSRRTNWDGRYKFRKIVKTRDGFAFLSAETYWR